MEYKFSKSGIRDEGEVRLKDQELLKKREFWYLFLFLFFISRVFDQ